MTGCSKRCTPASMKDTASPNGDSSSAAPPLVLVAVAMAAPTTAGSPPLALGARSMRNHVLPSSVHSVLGSGDGDQCLPFHHSR